MTCRALPATLIATREVSHVIQRRPSFSAQEAVVPEPQVGSKTMSPGSVVMAMQRSMTLGEVCTAYSFTLPNPLMTVSSPLFRGVRAPASLKRVLGRDDAVAHQLFSSGAYAPRPH